MIETIKVECEYDRTNQEWKYLVTINQKYFHSKLTLKDFERDVVNKLIEATKETIDG